MNPLLIAKYIGILSIFAFVFYAGQRYERSGWLEKEVVAQKALVTETQKVHDAEQLAEQHRAELEVKNVELIKTRTDLANANRIATERLRKLAIGGTAPSTTTTSPTVSRSNDSPETEWVLSIRVADLEKLLSGVDQVQIWADEVNDAYINCVGR